MKKRWISIMLAVVMTGVLLIGCGANAGKSGGKDENSITVLVESGSPAETLAKETASEFEEETGCKVIIDAVAYTGMYDKLSTETKQNRRLMMWHVWTLCGWRHLQVRLSR